MGKHIYEQSWAHDRKLIYAYVENELIKAFNKLYIDYKNH